MVAILKEGGQLVHVCVFDSHSSPEVYYHMCNEGVN